MTEEQKHVVYNARILTIFSDILDTHLCNLEESIKKAGMPFRGKLKSRTEAFRKCAASMRKLFMQKGTEEEMFKESMCLGSDSDRLYAILMLVLDRCGDSTGKEHEYKVFNMIKNSMTSRLKYDLTQIERNAFLD